MAVTQQNKRWSTPVEIFARSLSLEDDEIPRGWIKNSIVIEAGTRACAVVDGRFLGEIPAGEFTFHDFRDKLQFWRKGQATVLLTRCDIVSLPVNCDGFVSADDVPIDMRIDVGVQIEEPVLFMRNLMGPRKEYPVSELAERLTPPVKQEAWVATARLKVDELRGPAIATKVAQQVVDAIAPAFRRYGLKVFSVEGMLVRPTGMEKHWEKVKENNIEVAGERLTNQRMGEDVGILAERIALREKLRDIAIADNRDAGHTDFEKARNEEELKELIAGVDKQGLLREEEMDQLVEGFEQRKADRAAVRWHIVEVLEINRQQEIDQLRAQVGHALELANKKNELELAEATNSVENLEWRNKIAREIEIAENRREESRKDLAAKWERIREVQKQRRDGSWERLLHEQREESIRTELAVRESERKRRVELIEAEAAAAVEAQKIIAERHRREFELDMGGRESDAQFDRLKRVQDMNFEERARQVRLNADIENETATRTQNHELEKLRTMGTLSSEVLIATGNGHNALLLAELKQQELKSQADVHAAAAAAAAAAGMAAHADRQKVEEERMRLYEKLSEAERSKSEAIQRVFEQALKGQQDAVAQMIGGLAKAHTPPRPAAPAPVAAPPQAPGTAPEWHVIGDGNTQTGPHTLRQVQMMVQQGRLVTESLVWRAGMDGWVAIAECEEFADVVASVPPPSPPAPPSRP